MKTAKKILAFVLSLAMFVTCVNVDLYNSMAVAVTDKVTVTVNYLYKDNDTQVAQPYKAQLEKGTAFNKTIEVPTLLSHICPSNEATGLGNGITLSQNTSTHKYQLDFALDKVDKDIVVTVYYVTGSASATVYHYYQNVDDDNYTLDKDRVFTVTGNIGQYVKAEEQAKEGFKCVRHDQSFIAADNGTVIYMYYDRLYYTVVFDVNGGVNGPEPLYKKYGYEFNKSDIKIPEREGYDFVGWKLKDTDTMLETSATFTGNVTYVAQWKSQKTFADYTIVIWGQNADNDNYSYINSYDAWGNVGNSVTWGENVKINHTHSSECYATSCSKEEHTHTDACGLNCGKVAHTHTSKCCSLDEHTHSKACYSGVGDAVDSWILRWYFNDQEKYEGKIHAYRRYIGDTNTIYYAICIADTWYDYTGSESGTATPICGKTVHTHNGTDCVYTKCGLEEHTHSKNCYACGKEEHVHQEGVCTGLTCTIDTTDKTMGSLHPGSNLWKFEKSDTKVIDANGTTVLNVYFKRTEFTLTFKYSNNSKTETITERWGKNIKKQYESIVEKAGSSFWTENSNTSQGPYTNYIGVMPQRNITYYNRKESGSGNYKMSYFAEDLNGKYDESTPIFTVSWRSNQSWTVTDEDRYEFDGFTCDTTKSTENGKSCNGAKFYYKRNKYELVFWSGDTIVYSNSVLFEAPLSSYGSTKPTSDQKPVGYEDGAVFVGWYQNPECTGDEYDFDNTTMPSHNVTLYAKWQNIPYTVTTYTDSTCTTKFTYSGYDGSQSVEKYTLAEELTQSPIKEDATFVGWFYNDNGVEKPFSFTMPITKNYDLYPKFEAPNTVNYVVHYYIKGTTTKLAEDKTGAAAAGSTVAEKALVGSELTNANGKSYFPEEHSKSIQVSSTVNEIIFYYTEATYVGYVVRYVDEKGNEIHANKYVSNKDEKYYIVTEDAIDIDDYILVSEKTCRLELTSYESDNVITFVYKHVPVPLTVKKDGVDTEKDPNAVFMFRVEGVDDDTKDISMVVTVIGNGSVTIKDLPLGKYKITEIDSWSWRYEPTQGEQTVIIGNGGTTVTFTNERKNDHWLDDETSVDNIYKDGITQKFNPAKTEGE